MKRVRSGWIVACGAIVAIVSMAAVPAPNDAIGNSITIIAAHDHPFTALPSQDGSALFISVVRDRGANGILVVHRSNGTYRVGAFIPVDGSPTGLALTPDGRTLLVGDDDRYAALSATAAARDEIPPISYVRNRFTNGAIEVVSSADGTHAFFSDEEDDSVGIVTIGATATGTPSLAFTGRIPTEHLPVGMALSPDGARLYVTSEIGFGRPAVCARGRHTGSLAVIDVVAATANPPSNALLSTATAGCEAVRVALSPDGRTAWVTLRGDDSLAAFDTAKLVSDPEHALLRKARVGASPVGLALVRNGAVAFVANSNRFDPSATSSTVDAVDTAAVFSGGDTIVHSYATGAFPREIREAPQHDVVYVTNYNSGTVEVIPVR
jgi:DNA-binding beta-propeller fold protein YncE